MRARCSGGIIAGPAPEDAAADRGSPPARRALHDDGGGGPRAPSRACTAGCRPDRRTDRDRNSWRTQRATRPYTARLGLGIPARARGPRAEMEGPAGATGWAGAWL